MQDPVQDHHGQELLGPLVQDGHVLGAQVLAPAQPVLGRRPPIIHPGLGQLQGRAAHMQDEGDAGLGQLRPEGVEVDVPRRAVQGRPVRHPHRLEVAGQHEVQLLQGQLRVVQRNGGHAHQPVIGGAEVDHVPVVRPGRAIAQPALQLGRRREGHAQAVGREHQLLAEAEQVHGGAPVAGIEGPQGLDLLGLLDQGVTQGHLGRHVLGAVRPALVHDHRHLLVGDDGGRVGHLGDLVPQAGVGIALQEVRQLHDVAVGVIDVAVRRRVGHGRLLRGCRFLSKTMRRRRRGGKAGAHSPSTALAMMLRWISLVPA